MIDITRIIDIQALYMCFRLDKQFCFYGRTTKRGEVNTTEPPRKNHFFHQRKIGRNKKIYDPLN